jgi:hypothetical protein
MRLAADYPARIELRQLHTAPCDLWRVQKDKRQLATFCALR